MALLKDTVVSGSLRVTNSLYVNNNGQGEEYPLQVNGIIKANGITEPFIMKEVNLTSLDENIYYPVVSDYLPIRGYNRVKIHSHLRNDISHPSWATHQNGYTLDIDILVQQPGWGSTPGACIILLNNYLWSNVNPASISVLNTGGRVCCYLRGGGFYNLYTDFNSEWTICTSSTAFNSDTVSPSSTRPGWSYTQSTVFANITGNVTGNVTGNATTASALTDISSNDNASSSATWRRVWFGYDNNTTGRPAYSDNFVYQTSTETLKVPNILTNNYIFNTTDIAEGAANLATQATAHKMTFYRNGITIPYQMDDANDGGIIRVRGTLESNTIFELGTWDDSGAGETIQFNYYPTTSQVTPTYSVSVPKASGTLCLTNGTGASGTWGISISGNAATAIVLKNSYTVSTRPTNANITHITDGGIVHFKSTSNMTSNSPGSDGNILHFHWDTSSAWDAQLHIPNSSSHSIQWRGSSAAGTWGNWYTILDSNNYTSYALPKSGGTLTGAVTFANNTLNLMGDDCYIGDINKSGHIGIKGNNGNTGLFFITYNQSNNATGGAITWNGTNFSITGTVATNISGTSAGFSYPNQNGGDLNNYTSETHKFVFNMSNTPANYGFFDVSYFNGSGFTPASTGVFRQVFTKYDNATSYIRVKVGTSGSWTAWKQIWKAGDAITGAVWNDYAEYRAADTTEPGYVVLEKGDDTLEKTTERLQHFAGVTSDTWGFAQGETETAKTPIAVAGRVLVYTYQNRNNYKPGDCVCTAPNGTVDIMTREEIINYPDRIVGTVSCVPTYNEWGGGDRPPVKINGRIWIKVK